MAIYIPLVAVALPLGWYTYTAYTQDAHLAETVVEQDGQVITALPARPLAKGAVVIHPQMHVNHFNEWTTDQIESSYDTIQRIVKVWKKQGTYNYMLFGKENAKSHVPFTWQVVPYPQERMRFWKQLKVLWNVFFGASANPQEKREQEAANLQRAIEEVREKNIPVVKGVSDEHASSEKSSDPFCNPQIVERQRIFEGKKMNVLYNYAPLALDERQLHFLITPKEHRAGFADLTKEEYTEAMQLAQKITGLYQKQGYPIVYLYDKTGAEAGQSLPHWHEHLVFAATNNQALYGKLFVLKNMIWPTSALKEEELKKRVQLLREELKDLN